MSNKRGEKSKLKILSIKLAEELHARFKAVCARERKTQQDQASSLIKDFTEAKEKEYEEEQARKVVLSKKKKKK